ncbi:DUF4328 domain-containing protein [Streptomyces sp. NPDC057702]|uniref:DUF4328 domain-containing protein n=1 Tax=unclassified Streptomyces TaxID=2593676 RepID=UPI0036C946A5
MPAPVDLRRGLSTALTVLFGVLLAALVLVLIAESNQWSVVGDIKDGKDVSFKKADDADDFAAAMSFVYLLAVVPVIVVWAVWFRRLRLNAETFAPGQHRFSAGWAAGAWFTPVVNLWFPKQIANDIWRASSPQGPQAAPRGLLNAWWVTFLVSGVLSTLGGIRYEMAYNKLEDGDYSSVEEANDLLNDMHSSLGTSMFSSVVSIASAILALLLVRQITRLQAQRATLPPQSGPAPYGPSGGMPYGAPGAQPYDPNQPYGGAAPYGGPQYGGQQYGGGPGTPPPPGGQAPGPQQYPYGSGPAGY